MSKIITLLAAGYTNCVADDIGKQVTDDTVQIGLLLGYNNTTHEWWVDATVIVASGSVMAIVAGTGAGTSVVVYYTTLDKVKARVLIPVTTSTYDTELAIAIVEAERMIDDRLRPYLTIRQSLTLNLVGYVKCKDSDLGKQVEDDGVQVGELIRYNNETRIWKIETTSTIAEDSVITITDGHGSGTANVASTDDVTETETPIFIFKTLPLSAVIPAIIGEICADIAAGLFKRRHKPESFDAGWFNQGFTKLKDFIKGNWGSGQTFKFSH